MPFQLRYQPAVDAVPVIVTLRPGPTDVEYPETRAYKTMVSQDGAVIVQRPLRDSRARKWIWRRYHDDIPAYANLWTLLRSLEYRSRLAAGLPGTVEIWEDETGTGVFDRTTAGAVPVWTTVKLLQVHRKVQGGGGRTTYDESTMEFVVEDSAFTGF